MRENQNPSPNPASSNGGRKYPIRCVECGRKEVRPATISRKVEKNHDARVYTLAVKNLPVTRCAACGEIYFTADSDQRINEALHAHLDLLTPAQIRRQLGSLKLTQKAAARRLGVAAETLSRWVSGTMIQSRAMDNLLRAFFTYPQVRDELLAGHR